MNTKGAIRVGTVLLWANALSAVAAVAFTVTDAIAGKWNVFVIDACSLAVNLYAIGVVIEKRAQHRAAEFRR